MNNNKRIAKIIISVACVLLFIVSMAIKLF